MTTIKVGLFGIGLATYWPQFTQLKARLEGYQSRIAGKLQDNHVTVVDAGLVDDVAKARSAALLFKQEDVSIIFLYVSTYALSATVLPVVQGCKVPVVILNLQPVAAMDYSWFNGLGDRGLMTGEWLANCQACAVPEIANVFNRAGISFHQVTGTLDDEAAWLEIAGWKAAAAVAAGMRHNRLGVLGHYYNGMLDIYTDLTLQAATFGGHIQHLEMCDLADFHSQVSQTEIDHKLQQIHQEMEVLEECPSHELVRAAHTAVALDKMVAHHQLGSLCYYYEGTPDNAYEDLIASVIAGNSLLTAHRVPVAGEYEVKNVQAMKIMDLFDAGGSFTEFYGLDFKEDIVLMGHDGPGHLAIAEGRPLLKPLGLYHGKPGKGLSIEMKVKHGPVTLLSVVETGHGQLKLLVAEGQSVPGPILQIGNTNSRYKFPLDIKTFVNNWCKEGPAHHCAIGVGHIAGNIEKLGHILGMATVKVC
ncbi:arabinose isomerase [Chitinophaga polysaccharea]|uniref:arabinose isomerase n=1 Tax=Chitinophaga TaxID=79328 RepID=UPI001455539D|nr:MULTISPECIES: arabinose isomerase [Chitinophaga]NLR62551.1 arabinose isomerase [Chitinophaga polysaccharea]NLU91515.1 arabinose isomerase [Chitinophaga sp. Ak27]